MDERIARLKRTAHDVRDALAFEIRDRDRGQREEDQAWLYRNQTSILQGMYRMLTEALDALVEPQSAENKTHATDAREKWREVRAMDTLGSLTLGPNTFDRYIHDPKRIAFMLSRYKFAAKMLRDCDTIMDVGCGDGFGMLTLLNDTRATAVVGIDFDETLIDYAQHTLMPAIRSAREDGTQIAFNREDIMADSVYSQVDGIACLDVIEHVEPHQGHFFIRQLHRRLNDHGVAVIGTPNGLAAQYASAHSQIGHINLYDPDRFRSELSNVFRHVFLFSMSDEIVHTGFDKLAHYLMALAVK